MKPEVAGRTKLVGLAPLHGLWPSIAAEENADVEARIAQIEQMTLDQIAVFQCRILTDITTGRISPREVSAIYRALRNRLKAIEKQLREAG